MDSPRVASVAEQLEQMHLGAAQRVDSAAARRGGGDVAAVPTSKGSAVKREECSQKF